MKEDNEIIKAMVKSIEARVSLIKELLNRHTDIDPEEIKDIGYEIYTLTKEITGYLWWVQENEKKK